MKTNEIKNETQANILRKILALVASGATLAAAYDAVIGNGAFEKLANELYSELNK